MRQIAEERKKAGEAQIAAEASAQVAMQQIQGLTAQNSALMQDNEVRMKYDCLAKSMPEMSLLLLLLLFVCLLVRWVGSVG